MRYFPDSHVCMSSPNSFFGSFSWGNTSVQCLTRISFTNFSTFWGVLWYNRTSKSTISKTCLSIEYLMDRVGNRVGYVLEVTNYEKKIKMEIYPGIYDGFHNRHSCPSGCDKSMEL